MYLLFGFGTVQYKYKGNVFAGKERAVLKISRKKVKTVYALMYVAFVVGIISFIVIEPIDSKLAAIPGIAGIFGAFYCNWWLKDKFKCPKCSNTLLRARWGRRNSLVVDPLNSYDNYCSVCGEKIEIRFTDWE